MKARAYLRAMLRESRGSKARMVYFAACLAIGVAAVVTVSGVVSELGGSTSHLASLARERGIPMVLGVPNATHAIPDGAQVGVDGVAGIVRWIS